MASTISVTPTELSFVIRKGSTLRKTITWYSDAVWTSSSGGEINESASTPMDLTGYTAHMQVRTKETGALVFDLTTDNGGLTLGDSAGTITFFISAADTAAVTDGKCKYDLELIAPDGDVIALLAGGFNLVEEVTVSS